MSAARFASFGLVGAAATAIHAAVFVALVDYAGFSGLAANLVAFTLAFAVSWLGQSRWTFRGTDRRGALARFAAATGLGLALNSAGALAIVDIAGLSPYSALPVVVVLVPAIMYLVLRHWVFRAPPATASPPRAR